MTHAELIEALERGETKGVDYGVAQLLRPRNPDGTFKGPVPAYFMGISTSLDAVAALAKRMLPNGRLHIDTHDEGADVRMIFEDDDDPGNVTVYHASSMTECGARLAAILRAAGEVKP